jgi:hypothetical protein
MKKILQITGSYAPAMKFGGVNQIMYQYAKILSNKNYVEVYTQDVFDDFSRIKKSERLSSQNSLKVHYFRTLSSYLASRHNINISIGLIAKLIFNANKFDYIHLGELRGLTPMMLSVILYFNPKVQLVHSSFGMLSSKVKKYSLRGIYRKIYDLLFIKLLINRIDLALCESELEFEAYKKFGYKGKHFVLPHSIDLSDLKINKDNQSISLPKSDINFISISRIHPNKDLIKSIKFVQKISSMTKLHVHFSIIGNDEGDLANITNYIKDNKLQKIVSIYPPVYGLERFNLYKQADSFILLPKINLETSLASIEALSQNCFIVFNENSYIENAEKNMAGVSLNLETSYEDVIKLILQKDQNPINFFNNNFSHEQLQLNLSVIFS